MKTVTSEPAKPPRPYRRPRAETVLLLAGALTTIAAKLAVSTADATLSWLTIVTSDLVFFSGVACLFTATVWMHPRPLTARLMLVLASTVFLWSLANAVWLWNTGVQLQPGVIDVIVRHPREVGPLLLPYLRGRPVISAACAAVVLGCAFWLTRRILRPVPLLAGRRHLHIGAVSGLVFATSLIGRSFTPQGPAVGFSVQVLDFSSHWLALSSIWTTREPVEPASSRRVAVAGDRRIGLPDARAARPNVVLVLLESVSHSVSLGAQDPAATPCLKKLAGEGVEFVRTYVPVASTSKAFWATLSGVTPDLSCDFAEAVLADRPYEGLPSILRRVGYRSAFFQMAKGAFEGTPGVFANFAFDHAWFRENLEDPSANLGYLAGDDFRMLDAAFDWAASDDAPFLMMMITSVAHDPYEVPAWFGPSKDARRERYLQAVRYTDAFVEKVCEQLARHGLARDTLLCVMGDHGESFRADAKRGRWIPYEEVIRVPWVIRWPGHVAAGRRIDGLHSQLDVAPTILSLLGFDARQAGFDGRNAMLPQPADRLLYFATPMEGGPGGCVQGTSKWIYWPMRRDVYQLDLALDGGEQSPIPVTGPAAERLVSAIDQWQREARLTIDARRFRKRFLFDHWWTFSSGRFVRAYYVPDKK